MNPVKIAVAGTHSTGKTTFLDAVHNDLTAAGYRVARVADLGLGASQRGFPILQDHTHESTLWIITRGISLELEHAESFNADVVLVDRPVPDALGYYRAALAYRAASCPEPYGQYLQTPTNHHTVTYDVIFKTKLDESIPLGDNKPRNTDHRYRAMADLAISDVLTEVGATPEPLAPHGHADAARLVFETVLARVDVA